MLDTDYTRLYPLGVMSKVSELGKEIKAFRLDRGWSQRRMAGFLGVTVVTVNRLETGKGVAMDLTITKIRKQLAQMTPSAA